MDDGNDISYIFHEVPCKCRKPLDGGFIVFSEVDVESGNLIEKNSMCPYCGRIHKISEVHKSEIVSDGDCKSFSYFNDKFSDEMKTVLEKFDCGIYIYECVEHLKNSNRSGNIVLRRSEKEDGSFRFVVMSINKNGSFKVFENETDSDILGENQNE